MKEKKIFFIIYYHVAHHHIITSPHTITCYFKTNFIKLTLNENEILFFNLKFKISFNSKNSDVIWNAWFRHQNYYISVL